MELALGFDDEDFTTKARTGQILTSYNAKNCSNLWFESAEAEEKDTPEQVLKYRADYHYKVGNYDQASQCYIKALGLLIPSKKIMKREMQESLARCYMNVGNVEQTMQLIRNLQSDSVTCGQICQTLILMQQVFHKFSFLKDEIRVIQMLISMHHAYPPFWCLLAEAYTRQQSHDQTQPITTTSLPTDSKYDETLNDKVSELQISGKGQGQAETNSVGIEVQEKVIDKTNERSPSLGSGDARSGHKCYWKVLVVSCYLRAKGILSGYDLLEETFIRDRNVKLAQTINSRIEEMKLTAQTLKSINESRRYHVHTTPDQDDTDESSQDKVTWESLQENVDEFMQRWFPLSQLTDTIQHE